MADDPNMSDISAIINTLLRFWDRSVETYGGAGIETSTISQDMRIGRDLGWSESTAQQTRTVSFLIASSVAQMARSISALFESTEKYPLTFGHVPLARSIYEGVGQVKWILSDDDDLFASVVVTLTPEETTRRCQRRAARALLTTAASWQQCIVDADFQRDAELGDDAREKLAELEACAFEVCEVTKSKDGKWSMYDLSRPGSRWFCEQGWQLAWWPERVDWHPYGYVCAFRTTTCTRWQRC